MKPPPPFGFISNLILATFSLAMTIFLLSIPWRARSTICVLFMNTILSWSGKSSDAFQRAISFRTIGRNQVKVSPRGKEGEEHYERGMILFSGGTDSTLAAVLSLARCDKLHLVTFTHSGMGSLERSRRGVEKLQRFYEPDRIVHDYINFQEIVDRLYEAWLSEGLLNDKAFLINFCAICKLAMYVCAATYCKENDIRMIASGCNKDGADLISDSMPSVISLIEEFFAKRGIRYWTPVYFIDRTDWVLFDLGMSERRDLKLRATRAASTIQPSCELSFPLTVYEKGYFNFVYGQRAYIERCTEWYREKLSKCADLPKDVVLTSKKGDLSYKVAKFRIQRWQLHNMWPNVQDDRLKSWLPQ